MSTRLFTALSSAGIASQVARARQRVCYAAPGIHLEPAKALAALKAARPEASISVSLDFDEHTLRMGYGSLEAVGQLRAAGIEPAHSPGFRSAVLIVDDAGWVFTPTALYLEAEPQSKETPNAIRLTTPQVREILFGLFLVARQEAITHAPTPEESRVTASEFSTRIERLASLKPRPEVERNRSPHL